MPKSSGESRAWFQDHESLVATMDACPMAEVVVDNVPKALVQRRPYLNGEFNLATFILSRR